MRFQVPFLVGKSIASSVHPSLSPIGAGQPWQINIFCHSLTLSGRHGDGCLATVRKQQGVEHVSEVDLQQDLKCLSLPSRGDEKHAD